MEFVSSFSYDTTTIIERQCCIVWIDCSNHTRSFVLLTLIGRTESENKTRQQRCKRTREKVSAMNCQRTARRRECRRASKRDRRTRTRSEKTAPKSAERSSAVHPTVLLQRSNGSLLAPQEGGPTSLIAALQPAVPIVFNICDEDCVLTCMIPAHSAPWRQRRREAMAMHPAACNRQRKT